MNILFYVVFALLFFVNTESQAQNSYAFVGFVKSESIGIVPYKLQFTIDELGGVEGISEYDFSGKNKTTSKILGVVDLKKKEISFKEVGNVSTGASGFTESEFCFIVSDVLSLKGSSDKEVISGNFKSTFKNGEACISGQLYLANEQAVNTLLSQIKSPDSSIAGIIKQFESNDSSNFIEESIDLILWNKDSLLFEFEGEAVSLWLWDNDNEDYDRVLVFRDSEIFIDDFLISNQKREFIIDNLEKDTQIIVKALNVGYSPPNTVSMILESGEHIKTFSANLNKGESVYINLRKQSKL